MQTSKKKKKGHEMQIKETEVQKYRKEEIKEKLVAKITPQILYI